MCYPFLKYECRRFLNVTSRILLLGYINYLTLSVLAAFRRVFVIATYILQDFKSKINIEEDINPFVTGNTPVCGWRFEPVHVVLRKISLRFPSNSEADASELLINIEEIFIRYLESWVMNKWQGRIWHQNRPPPNGLIECIPGIGSTICRDI